MAYNMPVQSYTIMLLEANESKWVIHNICAGGSTWLLLAAFVVIPSTFTSFRDSSLFQNANQAETAAIVKDILHSVAHVGLLWVAGTIYLVGLCGYFSLWRVWRNNYTWLIDKLFV